MIRQSLLVVLPLALAACGEARTEPEPIETSADTVEEAKVLVDANGLGPAGAAPFRFGAARADVDAAISEALAIAPGKSRNEECGAGPMDFSQFGPLQIAYMDGELRGWFLREGEGVATSDGVQPGTTTFEGLKLEKRCARTRHHAGGRIRVYDRRLRDDHRLCGRWRECDGAAGRDKLLLPLRRCVRIRAA